MEQRIFELEKEVRELSFRVKTLEEKLSQSRPDKPESIPYDEILIKKFSSRKQEHTFTEPNMSHKIHDDSFKKRFSSQFGLSEDQLAGTLFNRLGIVAILLAVAFFLKWSFDNKLIGELGRIVIGIMIGLGFLAGGEFFQRRKYAIYGQGFTGGGIAVLYFSIFSAFVFYNLISQPIAFALMVLITLAAVLLAIRYDSRAIGILGIVGGFVTPFVLSSGNSNIIFLLTYIAILDAGVLGVAFFKRWPVFNYLTFFFTYLSFGIGYAFDYHEKFEHIPFLFLTLFFVTYLGVSILRNVRLGQKATWPDIGLILTNGMIFFAFSYGLLEKSYDGYLGFWAVLLGIIYLLIGQWTYRNHTKDINLSFAFLGIAAGFVTLAIPIQLDVFWVPVAWAAESVVILALSFKMNEFKVRVSGLLVLSLAIVGLIEEPFKITGREFWVFLSNSALSYISVITALVFILLIFRRQTLAGLDKKLYFGLQIVFNLLVIFFLTQEITAYYDYRRFQDNNIYNYALFRNAQDVTLSLVWGFYACTLVVLGFWRRLQGLRWFGLGFLVIVILKVFLYDLSSLSTPYRILSFVVLGIILLGISWLYHRFKHFIIGGIPSDKTTTK